MSDKTHWLAVWTIGSGREIPPRACTDETGALIVFATKTIADVFADQLRDYNLDAIVHKVSTAQIAELLAYNHKDHDATLDAADTIAMVEAQAVSAKDAERWARELADRFMAKLVEEWSGATTERAGQGSGR